MFGEKTDIPIIQVSLPGEPDAKYAAALGKALSGVRDQGYTLICIGQPLTRPGDNIDDFEAIKYMDAVREAATAPEPLQPTLDLQKHAVFPKIPLPRDYLPLVVAAAAVRPDDKCETLGGGSESPSYWGSQVNEGHEGPMGWCIFEWK